MSTYTRLRGAAGLYPLGLYLVAVPIVDVLMHAYPLGVSNVAWRFGMLGLTFANLGTVRMGLAMTGVIAAVLGHGTVMRVISLIAFAGMAVVGGLSVLYALDAVQVYSLADGSQQLPVLKTAVTAICAALLGTAGFAGVGVGALRAAQSKRSGSAQSASSLDAAVSRYPTISGGLIK